MNDIISILNSKPMFRASKGATKEEITQAEKLLSLKFSKEYFHYLSTVGFGIYKGHELTGICKAKRLDVVNVTLEERTITSYIPADWYVVEQANIDGIVIWQNAKGEIYQTAPNAEPLKICDSLAEYVENY